MRPVSYQLTTLQYRAPKSGLVLEGGFEPSSADYRSAALPIELLQYLAPPSGPGEADPMGRRKQETADMQLSRRLRKPRKAEWSRLLLTW